MAILTIDRLYLGQRVPKRFRDAALYPRANFVQCNVKDAKHCEKTDNRNAAIERLNNFREDSSSEDSSSIRLDPF